MNELVLTGCRTEPLGSYLKALGLLRLVGEQKDPDVRGHWRGDVFVLGTVLERDMVENFLLDEYAPTPVVSPWNGGSGFKAEKNPSAVAALALVEGSGSPRLSAYRQAIEEGHRVYAAMVDGSWDKARTVAACRERLPDAALAWIDTAVVLAASREVYPPLLGTGGNDGRFDFSVAFMQRLADVLGLRNGRGSSDREKSAAWLAGALFDSPSDLVRETIGQFAPGAVGGANSAPTGSAPSLVNPWDWVLLLEGSVVFASASARRLGYDGPGRAAVPFTADASPVGYGSAASGESSRGEIWAPLWDRPSTATEVLRLIEEGRVTWRGKQARSALDFARGASSLGVDRGIGSFVRHALLERNGLATAAVPAGRVAVRALPAVRLTAVLDPWVERVRRGSNAPGSVANALGGVERAIFGTARSGDASSLQEVLVSVAKLESVVGRAERFREASGVRPVGGVEAGDWLRTLDDGTPEIRLAASLASLHDADGADLRTLLRPVRRSGRRLEWTEAPEPVTGLGRAPISHTLAGALVRRAIDVDRDPRSEEIEQVGVQPAFRYGLRAPVDDIARFVLGELDDRRLSTLFEALVLLDWTPLPAPGWSTGDDRGGFTPPAWALLAPFFHGKPIWGTVDADVRLVPEGSWPALLAAGRSSDVLGAATRRLRAARLDPVFDEEATCRIAAAAPSGVRLAAALLVPVSARAASQLVQQITIDEE